MITFKCRRGMSLVEMIISVGIFSVILLITVTTLTMLITMTQNEYITATQETEASTFLYHLVTDVKSASTVSVEDDIVILYSDTDAHIYLFDDRTGSITRDDEKLVHGYNACNRFPIDDKSFIFQFSMTGDDIIESTMRCGTDADF